MSKRTHPHKRSHVRKAAKRKDSITSFARYGSRWKILAVAFACALLATAALAYWKADEEKIGPANSEATKESPVKKESSEKNVSTLSAKDLADVPPEAFHPQPPMAARYNAHSGGLRPGGLQVSSFRECRRCKAGAQPRKAMA